MRVVRVLAMVLLLVFVGFAMDVAAQPSMQRVEQAGFGSGMADVLHDHGGALAMIGSLFVIWGRAKKMFKPMVDSYTINRDEHDVMYEEYNIRNGGRWRRGLHREYGVVALHPVPGRRSTDKP